MTGATAEKDGLTMVEPCDVCAEDAECDGGPFCGCPCHDGSRIDEAPGPLTDPGALLEERER